MGKTGVVRKSLIRPVSCLHLDVLRPYKIVGVELGGTRYEKLAEVGDVLVQLPQAHGQRIIYNATKEIVYEANSEAYTRIQVIPDETVESVLIAFNP